MSRAINTITAATAADGATNLNIDSGTLFVDTTNNFVGVGTTSPIRKLSLEGGGLGFQDAGGSASRGITWNDSTTSNSPLQILGNSTTGNCFLIFATNTFGSAAVERLRIDASGNVGIGNTNPATALETASFGKGLAIGSTSDSANNITIVSSPTSTIAALKFGDGGSGVYDQGYLVYDHTNNSMLMGTNRAERLRIDSSGNVLIGATDTTLSGGSVGFKFVYNTTNPYIGIVSDLSVNSSNYHLYNKNATNNGYRFFVNLNGGITNFSANNTNLSDERLKTNISPAGNYLEKICSIPVKTFNYKDQGEDTEKTIGIIAQDVEAVIPELINNDGFGETPEDGIPLKTIYQTDIQYVLMRCIQELSAKVTALEAA
jgi:hypothetical protein